MIDLLCVITGIWLAYEVHIGNKLVINFLLVATSCAILYGYPVLALSGLMSVHSVVGNLLFYLTFIIAYLCSICLLIGKANELKAYFDA